jgi:hypothetical protein
MRTSLDFLIDFSDIFAAYAGAQKLYAADEPD